MENKKEKTVPFEYPRKCPAGHKHLSWGPGEERVYCWDCSRYYPVKACVRPQETSPSESED